MSPRPDLPWDTQTFKGIDCSKNEQKTARYLGYDDVGEYRKYQASHIFLNLWLIWNSTQESKRFRINQTFKILNSTKPQDRTEQFGGTIPELQQRYPLSSNPTPDDTVDTENRKRFMTSLLFLLVHDDTDFDPEKQMTLEREEFTNRPDNKTLPKTVDGPITPKWGPHPNESWGEPYNRAWMCISQFNNTWSRWNERQGKPTGLAKTPIPETNIPSFMVASNTGHDLPRSKPTVEVKQATSMLEPKTFSLYWADDIARKDELEAKHQVIPVFSQQGPDPRALPAAEWRDSVRVLYDFEKLKLNFLSVRLQYKEDDQDEALDLLNEDWSVVQAVCTRVDQTNLQKIKFRTRPQEVGEVLRERTGVPSVLKQYVEHTGHGHVQQVGAALTHDQAKPGGTAPLDESKGDPGPEEDQKPGGTAPLDESRGDAGPEEDQPPKNPSSKGAKKRAEKKAVEEKEEVFIERTLQQLADKVGRRRDPTAGPGVPDPVKAYPPDKTDDVLREHGGVDIRLPEERRDWTMKMLVKYGAGVPIKTAQPIDPIVMELSGATSALDEVNAAGPQDRQTERERQTAFYRLNAALASGPRQAGPDVHLCAIVLGIDETSPDEEGRLKCSMLEKDIWLYPWQINGIVDLFLKLIGYVPMSSSKLKDHASKPEVIHALEQLLGLPVSQDGDFESVQKMYESCTGKEKSTKILVPGGAFLADQTGMGKTFMVLFLIAWMVENVDITEGYSKPTLVVCPAMLVENWANACNERFPNIRIAIMYAEAQKFANSKLTSRAIPTSFTKKLPDLKGAPKWLRPAFEKKKHNAWVIFASIDTFMTRTVYTEADLDKPKVEVSYHTSNGEQKTTMKQPLKYVSKMRGMFGLVVMDEGHKYRNASTQASFSIKGLKADLILIVTATPMISSAFDMVGLLGLIYRPSYKKQLDDQQLESVKNMEDEEFYEFVNELAPQDPRRLIALDPRRIKRLLELGTYEVSRLFHIAEDIVVLRRNSSSTIPYSTKPGGHLCLQSFYPRWAVNTINVEHRADEREEFQLLMLLAARSFYAFLENFKPGGSEERNAPPPVVAGPRTTKHKAAFPVAPLRELAIITCSTKLARLHYQMKNAGLNTKVAFMNSMRDKGLGAEFLAVMTYEKGDNAYRTREDLLAFLSHGSPKLRVLFGAIYETCFVEGTKLLVVEDIPFCAKFYEDSCRAAWIHCEVLHSKLNQAQRQKLLDAFNDSDSSLNVLIIMIEVASTGLNLQKASHRVLSMIPAKRIGPQMQAENRVLRVDQQKSVEINRVIVKNSHDLYREARQTSNVRLEIATKSHLPAMQIKLLNVLNDNQKWLKEFRKSDYALRLLGEDSKTESTGGEQDEEDGATHPLEDEDLYPPIESSDVDASETSTSNLIYRKKSKIRDSCSDAHDDDDNDEEESDDDDDFDFTPSSATNSDDDEEYETDGSLETDFDDLESDEEDMALNFEEDDLPNFMSMSNEERETFNQDDFFARQLLKLNADHVYTDVDLYNEATLNRAIDLLHHKRQGQSQVTRAIGVHINYEALPPEVKAAALDEKEISLRREGTQRLAQKKKAMSRLRVVWSKRNVDRAVEVETNVGRNKNRSRDDATSGAEGEKAKAKDNNKGKGKASGTAKGNKRSAASASDDSQKRQRK